MLMWASEKFESSYRCFFLKKVPMKPQLTDLKQAACFESSFPLSHSNSRTVLFSALLPSSLPPSHRGIAMRIMYTLVIATQVSKQKTETLRVPFYISTLSDSGQIRIPFHLEATHNFGPEVVHLDPKDTLGGGVGAIMSEQELFDEDDVGESRPGMSFCIYSPRNPIIYCFLLFGNQIKKWFCFCISFKKYLGDKESETRWQLRSTSVAGSTKLFC